MGSASIPRSPIWGKRETELRSNHARLVQSQDLGDVGPFEDITSDCYRHLFDSDYLSGGNRCQSQSRGRCKRSEVMQSVCRRTKYQDGDHSP